MSVPTPLVAACTVCRVHDEAEAHRRMTPIHLLSHLTLYVSLVSDDYFLLLACDDHLESGAIRTSSRGIRGSLH
jgi:hypothetical protein